jgi:hypothetical protein
MKSSPRLRRLAQCGFASILSLAACQWIGQRSANAQTATVDFLFQSSGTDNIAGVVSGGNLTQNANVTAGSSLSPYTVDVWLVILDPGVADSSIGFGGMGLRGRSSVTNGGAFVGGTASSTGGASTIGVTSGQITTSGSGNPNGALTTANAGPFDANSSVGKVGGDFNSDKFADLGGTTSSTEMVVNTNSLGSDTFGGSTSGVAVGPTAGSSTGGWAWQIGTLTVTPGTAGSTSGATTKFTPTTPVGGAAFQVQYQDPTTGSSGGSVVMQVGSSVQWTVTPAVQTNSSVLNLSPSTLTFNVLKGAPLPATQSVTLTETEGTATTYSGSAPTGFSLSDPGSGSIGANGTNTLSFGVNSTATSGTVTGTYTITNGQNSSDVQGTGANKSVLLTENIGNAQVADSGDGSFGAPMFAVVGSAGSYAGLSSTAMSGTGTPGGGAIEHSVATILLGSNNSGGSATVSMAWRNRTITETPANDATNLNPPGFINGNPSHPPLNGLPLISDVVRVLGMAPAGNAAGQVDPFVLQMSFNPNTLLAEGATNGDMATRGNLYLATLIGTGANATWQNAITDNDPITGSTTVVNVNGVSLNVGDAVTGNNFTRPFIGTFAQWEAANPSFNSGDIGAYLGVWGVDAGTLDPATGSNYNAWAIINHNSDFAVVPEPSAIVLAAFGLLGGLCLIRRRKTLAAA